MVFTRCVCAIGHAVGLSQQCARNSYLANRISVKMEPGSSTECTQKVRWSQEVPRSVHKKQAPSAMAVKVNKLETKTKRGNSIFLSYSNPGSATSSPLGISSRFLNCNASRSEVHSEGQSASN